MTFPPASTATPASSADEGRVAAVAIGAIAAFLGLLAWPILRGEVYVADDLGGFHLPMRAFYARCLASGDRFDWIPDIFCGYYLQGEGQVGMYHPLHLLLYRLLPLQAAFGIELLLAYPFLIAGTFLFLAGHRLRRDAAILGAIVFAFSSFFLLHFVHPNAVAVLAHLPWILWAIGRAAKWSLALLVGSQLLLGHPQAFWISSLGALLWFLFLLPRLADARRLLALAEGAIVGLLLGAAQLLPTLEAASDSTRSAPSTAFLQAGSLHYANVLQLLEPYLFPGRVLAPDRLDYNTHELGFYVGALPPVLVAWLAARRLGASRRLATGALVLLAVAFLLAAGGWIPPLHRLVLALPGAGLFRNSARFLVLAELALAVLAALAFADLASARARPDAKTVALVLIVPIASAAVVLVGTSHLHP